MLTLIFSKDAKVVDAVVEGYSVLYLNDDVVDSQKALNLLMLVGSASQVDMTCIEELLKNKKFSEKPGLMNGLFFELWSLFDDHCRKDTSGILDADKIDQIRRTRHSTIQLIRLIGSGSQQLLLTRRDQLYAIVAQWRAKGDFNFDLVKEALAIFTQIISQKVAEQRDEDILEERALADELDHRFLNTALELIVEGLGT